MNPASLRSAALRDFISMHETKIRFLITGGVNTVLGLTLFPFLYIVLAPLKIHYLYILVFSSVACTLFGFLTIKFFVFRTRGNYFAELSRFVLFHLSNLVLNLVAVPLLVETAGISPVVAQPGFAVIAVLSSYFWHKHITFGAKSVPATKEANLVEIKRPDVMSGQLAAALKSIIRRVVPMSLIVPVYNSYFRLVARMRGFHILSDDTCFRIIKENKEIRLARSQAIYLRDTLDNFEFYFEGVEPQHVGGIDLVDYSRPGFHKVKNFDLFPVFFPAVAEPTITTDQYIEFANLGSDAVVIDLGAYSGLTSILFDMAIPSGGQVLAIEADSQNVGACRTNFAAYADHSKRTIRLVEAAVWSDNEGVAFSSEGSMGSSVLSVVGGGRGENIKVASVTLEGLAQRFDLTRVDFIKCDIEGGETEVFDRPEFFQRYSPKIMIECHIVGGKSTSDACAAVLEKYGYTCELVTQRGYPLPLLACARLHSFKTDGVFDG
jgi:FkbM family methyltransferase